MYYTTCTMDHQIPPKCETVSINAGQVWSKLHASNAYVFTTTVRTTFNIICEEKTTICDAEGTGMIQLDPKCIIQSQNYEIVSENNIDSEKMNILIPKINISDFVFEIHRFQM